VSPQQPAPGRVAGVREVQPGCVGDLAGAGCREAVGAVQTATQQSFSLPFHHALHWETLPGAPFTFGKPVPFAGSSAPARSCLVPPIQPGQGRLSVSVACRSRHDASDPCLPED